MRLTKAEEQIMQILWSLDGGTVQDILRNFGDEKPARTTVATLLGILERKGFVTHGTEGRTNTYRTAVSKEDYSHSQLSGFIKNYFGGSFSSMVSFFARENDLSAGELDKLLEETREGLAAAQKEKEEAL